MIMRLLTSFSLVVLFSVNSLAGGDRQGGGGWMTNMRASSEVSNLDLNRFQPVDYVKSVRMDESGRVKFQFKGFDSKKIQEHMLNVNDLSEAYLEAIKKSQETQSWEKVPVDSQ